MMRRIETPVIALLLAVTVVAGGLRAQDAKQSEREAMYHRYLEFPSYVKGGSIQPHWMADGSSFWYAEGAPANTVVYKVDPAANTKAPLFDTARLRRALTEVLGHEPPYQGLPFSDFTFLDGEKAIRFPVEGKDYILRLDTYTITRAPVLSEEEKSRLTPQVAKLYGVDVVMEVLSPGVADRAGENRSGSNGQCRGAARPHSALRGGAGCRSGRVPRAGARGLAGATVAVLGCTAWHGFSSGGAAHRGAG